MNFATHASKVENFSILLALINYSRVILYNGNLNVSDKDLINMLLTPPDISPIENTLSLIPHFKSLKPNTDPLFSLKSLPTDNVPSLLIPLIRNVSPNTMKSVAKVFQFSESIISDYKEVPIFDVKLLAIPDKGNKKRIISKASYDLQKLLSPFHEFFMNELKSFSSDKTYNQYFTREGDYFFCADLSQATDTFPMIQFIEKINNPLFKDLIKIINQISYIDSNGKAHKFTRGIGMGLLSSWSIFSYFHHIVLYHCYLNVYPFIDLKEFKKISNNYYSLLGDDIVIYDKKLKQPYLDIMNKLGVDINLNKSFTSSVGFEFAKTYVFMNKDITAFPFHSLYDSVPSQELFISNIMSFIRQHNYNSYDKLIDLCQIILKGYVKVNLFLKKPHNIKLLKDLNSLLVSPDNYISYIKHLLNFQFILNGKLDDCIDTFNPNYKFRHKISKSVYPSYTNYCYSMLTDTIASYSNKLINLSISNPKDSSYINSFLEALESYCFNYLSVETSINPNLPITPSIPNLLFLKDFSNRRKLNHSPLTKSFKYINQSFVNNNHFKLSILSKSFKNLLIQTTQYPNLLNP